MPFEYKPYYTPLNKDFWLIEGFSAIFNQMCASMIIIHHIS